MIPMVEERSEVLSETVVKGGNLWFFGVSISAATPCELMLALLQEDRVVGCLASAKSCKIDAASDGYVCGFAERWKTAWCRNSQGLPVAEEFLLKPKLDTNQWDDPLKTSTAEFTLVSTQPLKTSLIQGYFCRLLRLKPKKTGRFMECTKMCQLWWGCKFQLASTLYGKVRFLLKSVGWRWCSCMCWITISRHFAKYGTQSWLKEVDNGHLGFIKLFWVLSPEFHCWKIDDLQQTWESVCSWTSTNTQKSHPLTCFSIEMRMMLRLDALQRTVESVGMAVQRCGARDGVIASLSGFAIWICEICHLNLWKIRRIW